LDALFAGAVTTLVCVYRFWSIAPVLPYSKELVANLLQKNGTLGGLAFIPLAVGLIVAHVVLKAVAGGWGVAGGIIALAGVIMVAQRKLRLMGLKGVGAPGQHVGWHRSRN
jgi:hypothetical protein